MMLRTLGVALLVAILSLGACTDEDSTKTTVTTATTVTTTATTATTRTVIVDDEFTRQEKILLSTIRNGSYSDQFNGDSDARIIQVAHDVCDKLDTGYTVDEMVDALAAELNAAGSSDRQAEAVGYLLGGSITALCPQYSSSLNNY